MLEQAHLHRARATLAKQSASLWLTCVFCIAGPSLFAQGPPSYISPEVSADRRMTLRLLAPNAKSVVAAGELDGKPHPMTRGDNGVWSVTIGPLAPDIYTYAFNVDGVTRARPAERQHQVRLRQVRRGQRRPGAGRRAAVLRRQAGAARRGAHPPVYVEDARRQPDRVGLHAAGLRQGQELPGSLPAPRRRRHRVGLDDDRPGEQHHRQR